jgi:hypothetical protein
MQAANLISPFASGSDDSSVLAITISTTANAAQIPDEWQGCHVTLKMIGADVYWFFREDTTAPSGAELPDASVTGSATGNRDPQMGWPTRDGEVDPEKVPRAAAGSHVYLCYDGSGSGTLWVKVTSPP